MNRITCLFITRYYVNRIELEPSKTEAGRRLRERPKSPHLEAEVRGEASALVVSSDEVYLHRVCNLERQKVQQHLARKLSTVHVVTQEQIAAGIPMVRERV